MSVLFTSKLMHEMTCLICIGRENAPLPSRSSCCISQQEWQALVVQPTQADTLAVQICKGLLDVLAFVFAQQHCAFVNDYHRVRSFSCLLRLAAVRTAFLGSIPVGVPLQRAWENVHTLPD